jgi:hypothetical protein
MDTCSNIYRYNLEILSNIQANQTIYYEQNKIFVDDRYFSNLRYGNNTIKIIEIIKYSFLHYYNQLLLSLHKNDEYTSILNMLKESKLGLERIVNNESLYEDDKNLYLNLNNDLESLLKDIENLENVFYESSDEEIDTECESDSETCLRSMIRTTEEHLRLNDNNIIVNSIYVIKNKVTRLFLEVGNIIYNIVNF